MSAGLGDCGPELDHVVNQSTFSFTIPTSESQFLSELQGPQTSLMPCVLQENS